MVDQGLPGNPPREAAVIKRRGILRALGAGPLANLLLPILVYFFFFLQHTTLTPAVMGEPDKVLERIADELLA